ncbi:PBSX family phage terminase large subunit, partial [bacterium]|nr:PBSX family phage terminase large subunit [bacterium]
MEITVSNTFYPLFEREERYLILCGGRGSGKSEFAARKIFKRCMEEGGHRFLILRKVRKTAKESVLELTKRLLDENEIKYEYNKSDRIISFYAPNGKKNELLFDGLDDPEKIKSIKGLTGMWIEETTEFNERDFTEVDLCLREPGPSYKQIILSFNPDEALAPWLKKKFFDVIDPEAYIHNSTIEDNPIEEIRHEYRKQLDRLGDKALYKVYRLGEWAMPKGQIYGWDVWDGEHPSSMNVDEIFYGGDFGYSVNPATIIRIYRKADEFWVEEIIYKTGLTNPELAKEIKDAEANDAESYWDSAEPKSIQELYDLGIKAKSCEKGADSVRAGIDYLKSKKIHIIDGSTNIIKERNKYKWKEDKDGNPLPEPVKFDDH